jgi:uncharacterized membrane protein YqgA involved in biofilm formation
MLGTLVNAAAIIFGTMLGVLLGKKFPEKIQKIVFQGLGLSTILIGMQMALKVENILVLIFSLLLGGMIGETAKIEEKMENLGDWLKKRIKSKDKRFTDAFVTSSLLFCIGAMAIVGAINDGLRGDTSILYTKSILDGFAAIALGSTMGIGIAFSALPILFYQGGIALLATQMEGIFSSYIISQLTALGGLLLVGIGVNLLEIKKIKVISFLPALFIVVIFSLFIN